MRICLGKWGVNVGQTCIAPDYLLVEEDIVLKLVQKLSSLLFCLIPNIPWFFVHYKDSSLNSFWYLLSLFSLKRMEFLGISGFWHPRTRMPKWEKKTPTLSNKIPSDILIIQLSFHSLVQNSGWDYEGYNCAIFRGGSKHLCWHWPDCEWIPFPTAESAFRWSKDSRKNCLWWPMRQEVPVSAFNAKSLDYVLCHLDISRFMKSLCHKIIHH